MGGILKRYGPRISDSSRCPGAQSPGLGRGASPPAPRGDHPDSRDRGSRRSQFDTIYAEGQRRYVESLSAYARQFLGLMEKPDVDAIDGLSPAISIEQKTVSRNPRSTVGTVTEIYDYLRLLWARVGVPHCSECGRAVIRQSASQIIERLLALEAGTNV